MKISYFANPFEPYFVLPCAPKGRNRIHYPQYEFDIAQVLEGISNGKYEPLIEQVRACISQKTSLPCFTPSGTFRIRTDAELLEYSGIICLDYDNVESVYQLKKRAKLIPYTYAAFYSPSLKGVKVLVRVSSTWQHHKEVYRHVSEYYDKELGASHDPKCKNISRLCFLSCDRDMFYNEKSNLFPSGFPVRSKYIPTPEVTKKSQVQDQQYDLRQWMFEFTSRHLSYAPGSINDFQFRFGCNCNRYGIDEDIAIHWALEINRINEPRQRENVVQNEIERAYRLNPDEYGKFSVPQKFLRP